MAMSMAVCMLQDSLQQSIRAMHRLHSQSPARARWMQGASCLTASAARTHPRGGAAAETWLLKPGPGLWRLKARMQHEQGELLPGPLPSRGGHHSHPTSSGRRYCHRYPCHNLTDHNTHTSDISLSQCQGSCSSCGAHDAA